MTEPWQRFSRLQTDRDARDGTYSILQKAKRTRTLGGARITRRAWVSIPWSLGEGGANHSNTRVFKEDSEDPCPGN